MDFDDVEEFRDDLARRLSMIRAMDDRKAQDTILFLLDKAYCKGRDDGAESAIYDRER